ncbi:VCBS domain-containing protein, partial [Bradyrhizobium sp. th.b2]|uniref:VCBS domain-containing protein n=1 Tax=Bradyrhizobium sp. th-b2 TaxID=172088 RepID=UPI001FD8C942
MTEGDTAAALNTSGQLTITDPDTGEAHVVAQTAAHGTYGDFSIDANGAWTYTGNGAHDELTAGQVVSDTFTVTSQDGTASGTVTVTITGTNDVAIIDLDANNSTASGANYVGTFTDTGSAVAIADTDVSITDPDNASMASATVTLTNAKAGDVLAVNGTLPSGISVAIDSSFPGKIILTLSGSATKADYNTALHQIVFSTSTNPDTTDRNLTVSINDGLASSNTAVSTIHVLDATSPTVAAVAINDTQITDADTGLTRTATITFSEAMDQTSTPTITTNAGTTLTGPTGGHWVDSTHYALNYTVADAGVSLANVTFNVSNAKDAAGNTQVAATNLASATSVDTQNPTVSSEAIT